jgi:hypothetical protein
MRWLFIAMALPKNGVSNNKYKIGNAVEILKSLKILKTY